MGMNIISKEIFIQKLINPSPFILIDCSLRFTGLKNTQPFSEKSLKEPSLLFSFDHSSLDILGTYYFFSTEKEFFIKYFQ